MGGLIGSAAVHLAAWLLLAFLVERTLLVVARDNFGAQWNGVGAIEGVIKKNSQAPMVYRVLVPWSAYGLRRLGMPLLDAYMLVKIVLTGFALWSVDVAWGLGVAIMVAAILPATMMFDYWDWAAELCGLSLCLTGDLFLALVGVLIWGLSRETVLVGGVAFFLVTLDWLPSVAVAAASVIMVATVYLVQGKHERYCPLVWLRPNLEMIKGLKTVGRPYWIGSVVISLLIIAIAIAAAPFTGWKGLMVCFMAGFGLAFGRIDETRVFTSVTPWVGYAFIRLFLS